MTRESSEHARKSAATVVDPRASFALWLRTGRARKSLTLEDVARVTKIQPRILEKLESGQLDGLPAEVFVRGFVKCFARCVGLDESEALDRYRACSASTAPVARAFVETLAPRASVPAIEVVDMTAPVVAQADEPAATAEAEAQAPAAPTPARPAKDRARKRNHKRKARAAARARSASETTADAPAPAAPETRDATPATVEAREPAAATPDTSAAAEPAVAETAAPEPVVAETAAPEPAVAARTSEPALPDILTLPAASPWVPTMPSAPAAPSVPWRRGKFAAPTTRCSDPRLVIDDADPESAGREQEERAAAAKDQKVSFLPPILLDREDRSARQGGLTLAVILLLVAATLTLSYLMRRPSTSGDGVTLRDAPSHVSGVIV